MVMKISMHTDVTEAVPKVRGKADLKEVVRDMKEAGFDGYDCSLFDVTDENFCFGGGDYLQKAKELRRYADGLGIECNQTHAPFPSALPDNEDYNEKMFPAIVRAIEITHALGAKYIIVHPVNDYNVEQNVGFYNRLQPYAEKNDVRIAVENMWNWAAGSPTATSAACSDHIYFAELMSRLDERYFVACLDIGHSEMDGLHTSAVDMIYALKNRLKCLHVHGNDKLYDLHNIPFFADGRYKKKVDFYPIMQALSETGYDGYLTFEVNFISNFPKALWKDCYRFLASIGRYLGSIKENFKEDHGKAEDLL
jgi:sugar phosphate isomerase/epimerase